MTKKVSKKTTSKKAELSIDLFDKLDSRLAKLEKQQDTLLKGLNWAGKELKPVYTIGIVGHYLQEIVSKTRKS